MDKKRLAFSGVRKGQNTYCVDPVLHVKCTGARLAVFASYMMTVSDDFVMTV